MDWYQAKTLCEANGGDLAYFDSAQQYEEVMDALLQWLRTRPFVSRSIPANRAAVGTW